MAPVSSGRRRYRGWMLGRARATLGTMAALAALVAALTLCTRAAIPNGVAGVAMRTMADAVSHDVAPAPSWVRTVQEQHAHQVAAPAKLRLDLVVVTALLVAAALQGRRRSPAPERRGRPPMRRIGAVDDRGPPPATRS